MNIAPVLGIKKWNFLILEISNEDEENSGLLTWAVKMTQPPEAPPKNELHTLGEEKKKPFHSARLPTDKALYLRLKMTESLKGDWQSAYTPSS